jgi:hypothetical protein
VLCQPVASGRAYLTDLLRSRVAGSMTGDGPRVTIDALRERLAAGSGIEIMGYPIAPSMWAELEAVQLAEAGAGFAGEVDWLRLVAAPADRLPQKTADDMARLATSLTGPFRSRAVAAPAFWLLEEAPATDQFVAAAVAAWLDADARDAA